MADASIDDEDAFLYGDDAEAAPQNEEKPAALTYELVHFHVILA